MTDDEVLIGRFRQGDISAFDELMNKHRRSVYLQALRMTKNREDAEDISQEVFARVFKSLPTWKPKASFHTWLSKVALNLCIDYHRARVRHQTQPLERKEGFVIDIPTGPASDPLKIAEADELRQRIFLASEELSPRQRNAFLLRHFSGLSLMEVADAMGCAVGTVKAHLNRATTRMRDLLKDLADEREIDSND